MKNEKNIRNSTPFFENTDLICLHFHVGKSSYVKSIFRSKIWKMFLILFTNFGIKRILRSHFAGGVPEQGDMQKGSVFIYFPLWF